MKYLPILLACAAVWAASAFQAGAQDGSYTPPPATSLSPNLSASWILRPNGTANPARNGARRLGLPGQRPTREAGPARTVSTPHFATLQAPTPISVPPEPKQTIDPEFLPQTVEFDRDYSAGTIIIDTEERFLYLVEGDGTARRYGVGVGKPGFEWAGTHTVTRKAEWPDWRPPPEMIEREAKNGRFLPDFVDGGPHNPLGARALYLGSSLYRVHGTNQPWTIGQAVSSGCIRMRNEDVIDLYERVQVGTRVVVS